MTSGVVVVVGRLSITAILTRNGVVAVHFIILLPHHHDRDGLLLSRWRNIWNFAVRMIRATLRRFTVIITGTTTCGLGYDCESEKKRQIYADRI